MTATNVSPPSTYRHVAILRPGVFTDATGKSVRFTDDSLQQIADSYDPAYHCAALNLDHLEAGPAQGFVSDLAFNGAYLLADISGVPQELARDLSAGRYPFRSAEVYADLDGRGPYLRAVALLGARPPAVKGLPPMPDPESSFQLPVAGCQQDRSPCASSRSSLTTANCQLPTTQIHLRRNAASTAQRPARAPRIITVFSEVSMPVSNEQPPAVLAEPASTPVPAAAAPPADEIPAAKPETIRLAEDNARLQADAVRLAEENRALKAAERRREVCFFLAELRAAGQLTPALERAGVEQALIAAGEQPISVTLPGGNIVPLPDLLREVLKALPVSIAYGESAPPAAAATPALTPDEEYVLQALGLES